MPPPPLYLMFNNTDTPMHLQNLSVQARGNSCEYMYICDSLQTLPVDCWVVVLVHMLIDY